jgi:5-(carboxyamino)imidazole ribonucleotide mutase
VATVAIDGAENAALMACAILALKYEGVAESLAAYRERLAEG